MQKLVRQTELMGISYLKEITEDLNNQSYNLIIDAIFGFSFKPPMREPFGKILEIIHKSNIQIFSIDVPSGKPFNFYRVFFKDGMWKRVPQKKRIL